MRIVFVSYNYSPDINNPTDWLKRIRMYIGSLERLSLENEIVRIEQINFTGSYFHNGVSYRFISRRRKKVYFPWKLHSLIKKLAPEVVVVHGLHYPLQVIQLRLRLGRKIKIIAQNHAEKPFTGLKKQVQRLADHFIDAYFFSSALIGYEWVRNGNIGTAKKIHEVMEVSSNFYQVDGQAVSSKIKIEGAPVYLWVGRLNSNKDPVTVVNAFIRFTEIHSSARLYMIFQTSELFDEINNILANSRKNSNTVILAGEVTHEELLYWYNGADFIVAGSYYEGSGTAICEAMSCGCIPVITDIPSFRMMTDNGNIGFLYPPGDEDALLSALLRSITSDFKEQQNKVLNQFHTNLSFEAIANKIQSIARSI